MTRSREIRIDSHRMALKRLGTKSGTFEGDNSWQDHYKVYDHAEQILNRADVTEQHRVDALIQLNRAIDFRDKYLVLLCYKPTN